MQAGALAFAALVYVGVYVLFTGQIALDEVASGVAAGVLVAAYVGLQHREQARRKLRLRAPWLRLLFTPMAALVTDSVRVGAALLRALVTRDIGAIDRQPFRPGGGGPADAGRRALVTLASSLAPNGYVLDLPPSGRRENDAVLLVHHLAPQFAQGGSGMAGVSDWTVACIALMPAFAIPVVASLRGGTADRLVAAPLAGAVATILLVLVTFVFDQSSFIDIALCLALLTLPGTLALALFLERWL